MRKLILLLLPLFAFGCASNIERGNTFYQKGEYDRAAYYWNPLAQGGDPYAQYNVGLLWEYGLGSTKQSRAQAAEWYLLSAKQGLPLAMVKLAEYQLSIGSEVTAISWLNLAARWGDNLAISKLTELGKPIPASDLLEQRNALLLKQKKESDEAIGGMLAIGAIMGAAAIGNKSNQNIYPAYSAQKRMPIISPSSYNPTATFSQGISCSSDYSCGVGYSCVKKPFSSTGACMKSVDSYGVPTLQGPSSDSIGVKMEGSCKFSTDCPIGFTCDTTLKACVK